jgi:hypothetical protein
MHKHHSTRTSDNIDAMLDREERGDLIFGFVLLAAFPVAVLAAHLLA